DPGRDRGGPVHGAGRAGGAPGDRERHPGRGPRAERARGAGRDRAAAPGRPPHRHRDAGDDWPRSGRRSGAPQAPHASRDPHHLCARRLPAPRPGRGRRGVPAQGQPRRRACERRPAGARRWPRHRPGARARGVDRARPAQRPRAPGPAPRRRRRHRLGHRGEAIPLGGHRAQLPVGRHLQAGSGEPGGGGADGAGEGMAV
ncbi:MAG: Two-component transcriptional response regulator, LuxR family, partial [uncultured Gemmatimonadetes bacterium]